MGKLTISIAMFNSYVRNYQRVTPFNTIFPFKIVGNSDLYQLTSIFFTESAGRSNGYQCRLRLGGRLDQLKNLGRFFLVAILK